MRISVLIENTWDKEICEKQENGRLHNGECEKLQCEHGLSLFIEAGDKKILLDAGSTEAFSQNADLMGIALKDVEVAVLSHGHYDHSGGFCALFRENEKVRVYAQKSAMENYYSGSGGLHEIGIPAEVMLHKDRFQWVQGVKELGEGMYLIPHSTSRLECIGEKTQLYKSVGDEAVGMEEHQEKGIIVSVEVKLVPDNFQHEQSLVLETGKGLVIFNSCSHGGVANIIREVKAVYGDKNIYAYVGGLHMKGKRQGQEICTFSDAELNELCEVICKEGIQYVYTGHCTGQPGIQELKKRLGETVKVLTTGLQFEL